MPSARDYKDLLKESRRLAAKASNLSDDVRAEITTAQSELQAALKSKTDFAAPGQALDGLVTKHLGHLRKGKAREYFESIGFAILFALTLRGLVFEAFQIPTGSMEPTLLVGDHLFVSKASYGVRVPFTTRYLFRWNEVERGDIIVFLFPVEEVSTQVTIGEVARRLESYAARNGGYPATLDDAGVPQTDRLDAWEQPFEYTLADGGYRYISAGPDGEIGTVDDIDNLNSAFDGSPSRCLDASSLIERKDYIKRVIGLPGDRIALHDDQLIINGEPIPRVVSEDHSVTVHGRPVEVATETLADGVSYTTWSLGVSPEFEEITVREGHVFVMGDSRDNSSDGRCWGQVPMNNIKGNSMFIFFSRDRSPHASGGWFSTIRFSRFFDPVR